jgi:hypothetical protein
MTGTSTLTMGAAEAARPRTHLQSTSTRRVADLVLPCIAIAETLRAKPKLYAMLSLTPRAYIRATIAVRVQVVHGIRPMEAVKEPALTLQLPRPTLMATSAQ